MILPYGLDSLKQRPLMHVRTFSYDIITSYINGVDSACSGGFLDCFHQWLVPKVGYGNNLSWFGLVLMIAFPDMDFSPNLMNPEQEKLAIECLFDCLEQYWQMREEQGAVHIKEVYCEWLKTQDWYDPEMLPRLL